MNMEDEEVAAFGVIYGFLTLAGAVHVIMKKKRGSLVGLSLGSCRDP
jgi:hypothetical protein